MLGQNRIMKDWLYKRLTLGYFVGPYLENAVSACHKIENLGWTSTICPWNYSGDDPRKVFEDYKSALLALQEEQLKCYLSVKVPAMGYDYHLLRDLLKIAAQKNSRIHFDAQQPETANKSFQMIEKALSEYANISCTLPARWQRSKSDAERIIEWKIPVRVVKGEWADPNVPKLNPRSRFLDLIRFLSGKAAHVMVASHDAPLVKNCITELIRSSTSCELEQLYGLPIKAVQYAQKVDIPVRFYIPYGRSCLPYSFESIKRRPIILVWVIKDLILGNRFRLPNIG